MCLPVYSDLYQYGSISAGQEVGMSGCLGVVMSGEHVRIFFGYQEGVARCQ